MTNLTFTLASLLSAVAARAEDVAAPVAAAVAPVATAVAAAAPAAPKIDSGDTAWILISTAMVLLMTPGLAFFYGGMVRTKSVVSTLFQNFAALGVVGILWAVVGFSLSFGSTKGGVIGGFNYFLLNGVGQEANADYAATIPFAAFMLFQCMFAVITPILISGAIAERVKFSGFVAFTALWSLCVYAPVAHWVWGVGGWANVMGVKDFAGGFVVHMTAGFSAIMAVMLLKKRNDFGKAETKPYDTGMVLLGTTLLWFGWFGFNAGSALSAGGLATQAFGTSFFASAAAFVTWMLVDTFRKGKPSAMGAGVAAVAGLVTITPAAGFVTFGASILMGVLCGVICNYAVSFIKDTLKMDDTLDVIGCHGVGGFLGVICVGLFSTKTVNPAGADGFFYGSSALLITQLIVAGAVIGISLVGTFVAYKISDIIFGMRVTSAAEEEGLDSSMHGECINSNFTPPAPHSTNVQKLERKAV